MYQDKAWTPSGCYSQTEFDCPPAASQKNEMLLVRRNISLVLNLGFDVINGV